MPKTLLATALSVGLLAGASQAGAVEVFHANINAAQEVPTPTDFGASGFAEMVLNDAEDTLSYFISLTGLDLGAAIGTPQTPADNTDDITGLHFHNAPFGTTGPVVFGIIGPAHDTDDRVISLVGPLGGTISGAWEAAGDDGQSLTNFLGALRNQGLYLNVHTPRNPPGEIRGQVVPEPFTVSLLGLGLVGLGLARRRRPQ